ncbi:MAG: hypothetical protein M1835_003425 [Candelina submexicana]|nr:MAG: hypothetical protein M1835_003425 [Candelina submexicana]
MKVTLFYLLTAATACNFCSTTVARPVDESSLQDAYQEGDTDYRAASRRLTVRDQEAVEADDDDDPIGLSRRINIANEDADLDNIELPELPYPDLSRRLEIPGIPKAPKPGGAAAGSGSGASAGAKAPGQQGVGGIEKSDTHIGADSGAASKGGDAAAGSKPATDSKAVCKRTGVCPAPPGLTPVQNTFWTNAQKIHENRPQVGAEDSTRWGRPGELTYPRNYRKAQSGQTTISDKEMGEWDLNWPLSMLWVNPRQRFQSVDLRSKNQDGGAVMECDMSTEGRSVLIMEQKFRANDMNRPADRMPNFVLAKQAMQENHYFVPEIVIQRTVINTDTQLQAVWARMELHQGQYFYLSKDAPVGSVEHKYFNLLLGTDNVRPTGEMLNAFPRYFHDQEIQFIHIWKRDDVVHQQYGQFTLGITLARV